MRRCGSRLREPRWFPCLALLASAGLLLAGCQATDRRQPSTGSQSVEPGAVTADPGTDAPNAADTTPPGALQAAATGLVSASPERWTAAVAGYRTEAGGEDPERAAAALIAALEAHPIARGGQPAVALLGATGCDRAHAWLLARASEDRDPLAADAALALARTPATADAIGALESLAAAVDRPRHLRTCAAATLLDWGEPAAAAPFLHAVLVGGTPQGQTAMGEHGLEDDTRWALDRSIAIAAIDRWAGRVGAYDLDPDLPWPLLAERADRFLTDALEAAR